VNREQEALLWTSTATVPDKIAKVPDSPLDVRFGSLKVYTNETYDVDQLLNAPTSVTWPADPDALYTFIIEDQDIPFFPVLYTHMLVTNIRGNNFHTGDLKAAYVPVFDIELNEAEDGLDRTPPRFGGLTHRYVFMVFKQKGYINVPEVPSGCTEDFLTARTIRTHKVLQETYDLEGPVAGTFLRTGHSRSGWTEFFICKYTRCLGQPFPKGLLPGINDKPECQKTP